MLPKEYYILIEEVIKGFLSGPISPERWGEIEAKIKKLNETQKYLFRLYVAEKTNGVFNCKNADGSWYKKGWYDLTAMCLPKKERWHICEKEIWDHFHPGEYRFSLWGN